MCHYTFLRDGVSSTTDYIITNAVSAPLVSNSLMHNHPLNSSDHLPLSLSLNLSAEVNCESPVSKCLDWQRGSRDGFTSHYATCINGLLEPLIKEKYASISELEEEICFVSKKILDAASSTIPIFKAANDLCRILNGMISEKSVRRPGKMA